MARIPKVSKATCPNIYRMFKLIDPWEGVPEEYPVPEEDQGFVTDIEEVIPNLSDDDILYLTGQHPYQGDYDPDLEEMAERVNTVPELLAVLQGFSENYGNWWAAKKEGQV